MSTVDSWYALVWPLKLPVLSYATTPMSLTLVLTMWQETFTDVNIQTYISFFEHFDRSKFEYFFKPTKSDFDIFQFWLCIFPMNLVVLAHKIFKIRFTYLFWYLYFWEYIEKMWQIPPNVDENKIYEEVFVITC